MKRALLMVTVALTAAACTTPPPPKPVDTTPPPPEHVEPAKNDGNLRLNQAILAPSRYTLDLTIDPASDTFKGTIEIDIDIKEATWFVQMHAGELEITSAEIETSDTITPEVIKGENGGLVLKAGKKLAPGLGTVRLGFTGGLGTVPESLYRVKEGENWYAYTQFEPLEARDAFPCFDEPVFKTPYAYTVRVPKGQVALTNTPETSRKDEGEWSVFSFAETRPLPTYLVAFAVGDFDIVEAPADAIPNVPLRIITTKGKGDMTKYVIEKTPLIMKALTDYFGSPYPYRKLDMVAVPNFAAGAMENVGLVTYRETLLLFDGETASVRTRYSSQSVIAHELAHMWFGNLVTLEWWNDLWLNEGFATWMATKTVAAVAPELEAPLDGVRSAGRVMGSDTRVATRAVRQPIAHGGDVYNAFDGITYGKGAAVLRMVESWTGEEAFRKGVRDYLSAHAYSTATTADLFAALTASTGKPIEKVMTEFIDQPGVPLVDVEVVCKDDAASIKMSQSRYLPTGSKAPQGQPWKIPVCMRYKVGDKVERVCDLLDAPEKTIPLETKGCPVWLHPNADQKGYYRWSLPSEQLQALVTDHRAELTLPERVAMPGQLGALLEASALPADAYLNMIQALSKEEHRLLVAGVIDRLDFIHSRGVPAAKRAKFQKFVRAILGPHLKRIGTKAKKGEAAEIALIRPRLVRTMVVMGADKKLVAAGKKKGKAFLRKMSSVAASEVSLSLQILAWEGNKKLWDQLVAALAKAETPAQRRAIIGALGNFSDKALLEASYNLLLDGTLREQDYWSVIGGAYRTPETHAVMWSWVTTNYDKILEKLGDKRASSIPWAASGFCSAPDMETAKTFFAQPGKTTPQTERNLSLAMESIERCIRLKAIVEPGVDAFLK